MSSKIIYKFLPYKKYTFHSTLSREEVIQTLKNSIDFEMSYGFANNTIKYSKPYVGMVYGNLFEIRRVIDYKNAFLPKVKGEIIENETGVIVNVEIKLMGFIYAFLILWFGFCLFSVFIISILAMVNKAKISTIFFPLFMLLIGSTIAYSAFESEAESTKSDLDKILGNKK
ncbi:hypothetical protein [Flavobacterium sp.]|uniref:hypothetical protein n=1 Tax=Flavobacterium sp. TaxID=239 RepID=UPI004048569C